MSIKSSNKVKVEGAMSSMTDLVFLLLIFFIILSTMVSSGITVDLPKSTQTETEEKSKTIINVEADNSIYIQGNGNERKQLSLVQLETKIMDFVDKHKIVELAGDKASNWETTVGVIDIVKQNKLKLVIVTKK